MSKKLLMNNRNDNSLLPTQDGLVCWLDAFDLTTYELGTIWKDRMGNNDGNVVKLDDFQSVGNGVLHASSVVDIPNPTKGLTSYTVEVGYEDLTSTYWSGLWGNCSKEDEPGTEQYGLSVYQAYGTFGFKPNIGAANPSISEIMRSKNYVTVTFNSSGVKIYQKGVLYTSFTMGDDTKQVLPSQANYLCFMGRKPNTPNETTTSGADNKLSKWYYIRVYNRELTEEEITNNYNYELSLTRGE